MHKVIKIFFNRTSTEFKFQIESAKDARFYLPDSARPSRRFIVSAFLAKQIFQKDPGIFYSTIRSFRITPSAVCLTLRAIFTFNTRQLLLSLPGVAQLRARGCRFAAVGQTASGNANTFTFNSRQLPRPLQLHSNRPENVWQPVVG